MKKVFVLTAILLGAVAVSCQKNAEYDYSIQPTMRTVTCTINDVAEPGTKVAINSATGKTEWEVGDEILFHGKNAGGKYSATVILTADNISADVKIYPQVLENVRVTDKDAVENDPEIVKRVDEINAELGNNGRLLLRKSGTEPLIRVMVEAKDEATCHRYVDEVAALVKNKAGLA